MTLKGSRRQNLIMCGARTLNPMPVQAPLRTLPVPGRARTPAACAWRSCRGGSSCGRRPAAATRSAEGASASRPRCTWPRAAWTRCAAQTAHRPSAARCAGPAPAAGRCAAAHCLQLWGCVRMRGMLSMVDRPSARTVCVPLKGLAISIFMFVLCIVCQVNRVPMHRVTD